MCGRYWKALHPTSVMTTVSLPRSTPGEEESVESRKSLLVPHHVSKSSPSPHLQWRDPESSIHYPSTWEISLVVRWTTSSTGWMFTCRIFQMNHSYLDIQYSDLWTATVSLLGLPTSPTLPSITWMILPQTYLGRLKGGTWQVRLSRLAKRGFSKIQ